MSVAESFETGSVPAEVTTFVGRRREVAEARRLLAETRLLTLTGPGGVGKTRLAIRVATEVRCAYEDGVWFVELAALEDPELLAGTIAAAMGVNDQSARSPAEALSQYLAPRRLLIVLDNCEHLLDACATLVRKLLGSSPELRVLATSRQALGSEGEAVLAVPPLQLRAEPSSPEPDSAEPDSAESEAAHLFAQRAAAASPGFRTADDNRGVVNDICRRLDGIPLAIELAAVRMRALSATELLERLDDRFTLLTTGSRAALPRQQTLRAAIGWSHDLCSEQERDVWARLSVFSGGFDLEAAEHVCAGGGIASDHVFDLVAGLVDKSIVARQHGAGVRTRYVLLETLRQYGLERLRAARQILATRTRHRDHYRAIAHQARLEWFSSRQVQWHLRLRDDLANLRAAVDFSLSRPAQVDAALDIVSNLGDYWMALNLREGRRAADRALAASHGRPSAARTRALWTGSWLSTLQGDTDTALAWLKECRPAARRAGDREALARVDQMSGIAALYRGEAEAAETLLSSAMAQLEESDDAGAACVTAFYLALAAAWRGEADTQGWAEKCLSLCETHDATWSRSYALWSAGYQKWRSGRLHEATELLREGLRSQRVLEDQRCFALCTEVLAWVAEEEGRHVRAARLLALAQRSWRTMGAPLRGAHVAGFHDACEAGLRSALGDAELRDAQERAGALPHSRAVDYALEEPAATPADRPPAGPTLLTRRETQVADLVSQGLTSKDIAAKLVISHRTVESHVDHILTKLGFTSRAQIAAWATRHLPDSAE